jgi:glycosyltransferase involved in cell wall biosynthesis
MKILFLIPSLSRGGAQWHLVRDANGLAARGHEVAVAVVTSDTTMAEYLSQGISVHALGSRLRSLGTPRKFADLARTLRPDVVIGVAINANIIVVRARAHYDIPRVVLMENAYPPLNFEHMNPVRAFFLKRMIRSTYKHADVVTGNSDETRDYLVDWIGPGPRYERVYNPVDFDHLAKLASADAALPARGAGEIVLLAAGRLLNIQKGFDTLLRACALIDASVNWKLWMLGDGPDREALHAQASALGIADRVLWLGTQKNPFPFYRAADIAVLPSRFEGFPNMLMEVLALGKATISTDCLSGPRELTANGTVGVLVPVDDVPAIAAAASQLAADASRREELGRSAAAHIRAAYSDTLVFDHLQAILRA